MKYSASDMARWVTEDSRTSSRSEFERDRGRVLHSSALRRLGTKTQVLGPESDDFVRTRLTHSLEVAQVGRSLALNLGADADLVEVACLCHDIGHPPFGHNGETVLAELASEAGGFEGNAQTLRVITRLEPKRFHRDGRPAGLNLTRAAIDATIKYPWPKGDSPKFGVYADDMEVFEWVRTEVGRCAEAQMMDLADDIAYCVHDFEDGIVRNSILPQNLAAALEDIIADTVAWYGTKVSAAELEAAAHRLFTLESFPESYRGTLRDRAQLKDLTSDLIGRFISAVTLASREASGGEPIQRYANEVVIPRETLAEITFLKGLAVHFVMVPRGADPEYFEQRNLLRDLFDAIMDDPYRLEPHFSQWWEQANNQGEKVRVVIDQLASLTDRSALVWHARYCGMLRH